MIDSRDHLKLVERLNNCLSRRPRTLRVLTGDEPPVNDVEVIPNPLSSLVCFNVSIT